MHRLAALLPCLVAATCSVVPEAAYPPFADHDVTADFVVADDGLLRVPASSRQLVVQQLTAEPRPERERFGAGGERWLVYPAGTPVCLHCRFRAYAGPDDRVPSVTDVLPGALRIRSVEAP